METLLSFIFIVSLFSPLDCTLEDGWMGIKVFETSREDVEKRLGKPTEQSQGLVRYETDQDLFSFYFADEPCSAPGTLSGSFNVKKGIVLEYSVTPKKELRVDGLKWSHELYTRSESLHQRGIVLYWNDRDGIHFETNKIEGGKFETVRTIYFQRSPIQAAKFGCSSKKNDKK